jgi:hypothetical protein
MNKFGLKFEKEKECHGEIKINCLKDYDGLYVIKFCQNGKNETLKQKKLENSVSRGEENSFLSSCCLILKNMEI